MINEKLKEIYELLYDRFGPQSWWPGDSQFEIIIGAILTQNTNWSNVEKAIANLKEACLLTPAKMHALKHDQLGALIRPAGYFNVKAKRVKNFLDWLFDNHAGDLSNLEHIATSVLREELLAVKGIGPETADSILLYAFDREVFVVDAYTARVAVRHGLVEADCDYHSLQDLFQSGLMADVKLFNEFHALIVRVGKEFCRPKARCDSCPLQQLPHNIETNYD